MCIIVDKNTFSGVFDPESTDSQFKPVHNWIFHGNGKIVYGGKKYREELSQAVKYLKIVTELSRKRKTNEISDSEVDSMQEKIEELIPHSDFDDPHLIAIVIVSGCRLICSKDSRCHKFVKTKQIYPKNFGVPKFYGGLKQRHLLTNNSIKELCKICKTKKI
jgi:hypothetical protein